MYTENDIGHSKGYRKIFYSFCVLVITTIPLYDRKSTHLQQFFFIKVSDLSSIRVTWSLKSEKFMHALQVNSLL